MLFDPAGLRVRALEVPLTVVEACQSPDVLHRMKDGSTDDHADNDCAKSSWSVI